MASCPSLPPTTPTTSELHASHTNGRALLTLSRYSYRWSRHVQDAILTVLLTAWIGGMATPTSPGELGRLLTLEQVGEIFQGPYHPSNDSNPTISQD